MKLKKISTHIKIEKHGATFTLRRLSDFERFSLHLEIPKNLKSDENDQLFLLELQSRMQDVFKDALISFSNIVDEENKAITEKEVLFQSLPMEVLTEIVTEFFNSHNEEKKIITEK